MHSGHVNLTDSWQGVWLGGREGETVTVRRFPDFDFSAAESRCPDPPPVRAPCRWHTWWCRAYGTPALPLWLTLSSFSLQLSPAATTCFLVPPCSHAKVNGRVYLIINRWVPQRFLSRFPFLKWSLGVLNTSLACKWKMASSDSGRGLQVRWMSFANPAIRRLDRMVLPSGLGGGRGSSAGPRLWPGSAASPTDVALGRVGSRLPLEHIMEGSAPEPALHRPARHCRLPAERNCPCSEFPEHFLIAAPRHWPSAPICLAILSPLPEASTPQAL